MKKYFKKLLLLITLIGSFLLFETSVSANAGDTSGQIGIVGSGCSGTDSCWNSITNEYPASYYSVYGIRVTIVDSQGNMVSARSFDYVGYNIWATIINGNRTYYRCLNNPRNRTSYLNGASCNWRPHDGTTISRYLDWLPDIYHNNNAAETIKNTIINMSQTTLEQTFFNDLGYTVPNLESERENHYLIIEPLTFVTLGSTLYYGTYSELALQIFYSNGGVRYNWVSSVVSKIMPFSIYLTGNTDIGGPGGYNQNTGAYFKGLLKIAAKGNYVTHWDGSKQLYNSTVVDQTIGYGVGVYWLKGFTKLNLPTCDYNNPGHFADSSSGPSGENCCDYIESHLSEYGLSNRNQLYAKYPQCRKSCDYNNASHFSGSSSGPNGENCCTYIENHLSEYGLSNKNQLYAKYPQCRKTCDYNNASHFSGSTSGPNGENCCQYVIDNLGEYHISKSQLFTKYPQCRSVIVDSCRFDLSISQPTCNGSPYGNVSDTNNWDCIYASAYSNDATIKNYFLKYGSVTTPCSVYCRDELTYRYPTTKMKVLAGTYFTISNKTNDYIHNLNNTFSAASLGPVEVTIKRECKILGNANNACRNAVTSQLNNIPAPNIEFAYESDYYNNPSSTLTPYSTSNYGSTYNRTVTYRYSLPSSTYKYVSKSTGVSHKNLSTLGGQEYINIGAHSPIHFTEVDNDVKYQLTISKFNLPNFDRLILNGQSVSTKFSTSIETYIKTLMETGRIKPTKIGDLYYLDQTFIKFLNNNNYSVNDFLNSTCANTSNYTCYSNDNGIYCYDKNRYTNSEQTYVLLNACINNEVRKLNSNKVNYKNDMLYECNFAVEAPSSNIGGPDNNDSGFEVIFRPISLDNPFPSIDADGRNTGSNWSYREDKSSTNRTVETVITNNRGVKTENLYKDLDPLYKITLTPAVIKQIRKYNNTTTYDDFNLVCDSNGSFCKSNFIRQQLRGNYDFRKYFSGCGISNKSAGLRCQNSDKW